MQIYYEFFISAMISSPKMTRDSNELIKRPGRLLNFWTLRVAAYSRWAFIRGWALIKFSPFSASTVKPVLNSHPWGMAN